MLKLEDQVCSLDLAKRLKELGVKQDSYFYYEWYSDHAYQLNCLCRDVPLNCKQIAAFSAGELGEMLPLWWDSGKREDKDYICRVFEKNVTNAHHSFGSSEADARAKMLIYLLENGLIKENGDATKERDI